MKYLNRNLRDDLGPDASGHYTVALPGKKGQEKVLSEEVELLLAKYINFRQSIASPVSKSKVSIDIKQYIEYHELVVKLFKQQKPGKNQFLI